MTSPSGQNGVNMDSSVPPDIPQQTNENIQYIKQDFPYTRIRQWKKVIPERKETHEVRPLMAPAEWLLSEDFQATGREPDPTRAWAMPCQPRRPRETLVVRVFRIEYPSSPYQGERCTEKDLWTSVGDSKEPLITGIRSRNSRKEGITREH